MNEFLNDLDREILRIRLEDSAERLRVDDDRLDVDALGSTQQLQLLIDLYIRGWTPKEMEDKLIPGGRSFDS